MIPTNYWANNQEIQEFEKNSRIVSEKLLASETGKTAEFYQNQIFQTITAEETEQKDKAKEIAFQSASKNMRKTHRPDLAE